MVRCTLFIVRFPLSVAFGLSLCLLFDDRCSLFVVGCSFFVRCLVLLVVCSLLFVVARGRNVALCFVFAAMICLMCWLVVVRCSLCVVFLLFFVR